MKELRDLGNTVLVVEHDPLTIQEADYVVDIGPGAGKHGGKILFKGTPAELKKSNTLTGQYLRGKKKVDGQIANRKSQIAYRKTIKTTNLKYLTIKGATHNNLKNINVKIPLAKFVCVSGVSGSGGSNAAGRVPSSSRLSCGTASMVPV